MGESVYDQTRAYYDRMGESVYDQLRPNGRHPRPIGRRQLGDTYRFVKTEIKNKKRPIDICSMGSSDPTKRPIIDIIL